jgi:hypothetical protein
MMLDKHIRQSMEVWSEQPSLESECNISASTWERRLNGTGILQALLQPAHVAAFLLDPLYAVVTPQKTVTLPIVSSEHEEMAKDLIGRVGPAIAVQEVDCMSLRGWDGNVADGARICATPPNDAHEHGVGNDERNHVAAAGMRKGLWKRYGMARHPALAKVALRL